MLRRLIAALGLVELLIPGRFIEFFERYALENPEECSLRPWVTPVARLEGLITLVVALRPGTFSGAIRSVLGWHGLLAALSPQGYLDYWTPLVYEEPADCEWKPWVVQATRAVGVLYVLIALFGWGSRSESAEETEGSDR
jgi:hypothetical protein